MPVIEPRTVTLSRDTRQTSVWGTFGELDTGSYKCVTLERMPVGDHPCIPFGEYDVDWTTVHPHHSPCYEVMNVPNRTAILIHPANWMDELLGCIAPGKKIEIVEGKLPSGIPVKQKGVSGSRLALTEFLKDMDCKPFKLVIREI